MKIAVLLKGIFYLPSYSRKGRSIDFRRSEPSLKKFFANHEVHYFISTYDNPLKQEILKTYEPKSYEFRPYSDEAVYYANNISILKVLALFMRTKQEEYDYIILSRPDITFEPNIKFEDLNIKKNDDALTIMRLTFHPRGHFEDNFNVIGARVLADYERIIRNNLSHSHHYVLKKFQEKVGKVVEYSFRNYKVTPGHSGFYRLIKLPELKEGLTVS